MPHQKEASQLQQHFLTFCLPVAILIFTFSTLLNAANIKTEAKNKTRTALAKSSDLTHLTVSFIKSKLFDNDAWLNLLAYRQNVLNSNYKSQADDPHFFLSEQGKTSPKQEMVAFLQALDSASDSIKVQCQFPARYFWIKKQALRHHWPFQIKNKNTFCPAFEKWKNKINASRVTLVLASSYLNSPSSMFGHTFLRLDASKSQHSNLLLSYTVSYAADEGQNDNELMFAYRGIFGGYPGVTSVVPYYDKIKTYSSLESRDLWEYQLNLTPAETEQLIRATWEIKNKRFDYYFFDENCAYRLLALLDIARPGTGLLNEVHLRAIPSDTIKWVVQKGLVKKVVYRPSAANKLASEIHQLSSVQRQLVRKLASGKADASRLSSIEKSLKSRARVLDVAFNYLRYQAAENRVRHEKNARRSHKLLVLRSKIEVQSQFSPPPTPIRSDMGHDTLRLSAALGRAGEKNYLQLSLRPAYHDLSDPVDGFIKGSQLVFLQGDVRYYFPSKQLKFHRLTLLDIRSLTPRNNFFTPISWQVSLGAKRINDKNHDQFLSPYFNGGAGVAYNLKQSLFYALAGAEVIPSKLLSKGIRLGPRFQFGWLLQKSKYQTMIELTTLNDWLGKNPAEQKITLSQSFTLAQNISINFNVRRQRSSHQYDTDWKAGLRLYF